MKTRDFYFNTKATFKGCKRPKRRPDYVSLNKWGYTSSLYWYGEDKHGKYVIRESNHWSYVYTNHTLLEETSLRECKHVASCFWALKSSRLTSKYRVCGKCYLKDFKAIGVSEAVEIVF